ncbi:MAG TPA: class I SAM-dependent methyltransferase, partial [Thermomicrobiales bacterium]|nr:class I SAM-dependent methyltransferase [Thermomicrobiales bacterium]
MTDPDHSDDPPRPRATAAHDSERADGDDAEAGIWASGDAYEPYVGRWSRRVARAFVAWLEPPPNGRWLDVGCGTGALTETILEQAAPRQIVGVDPAAAFLGYARSRLRDPRCVFVAGDVFAAPTAVDGFDAVVSGLALNFMPDPAAAVAEMARLTRPGGIVAAYVWDYAGEMHLMRQFWDAAG